MWVTEFLVTAMVLDCTIVWSYTYIERARLNVAAAVRTQQGVGLSTYSLWDSMLAFESGGLKCVLILTEGR